MGKKKGNRRWKRSPASNLCRHFSSTHLCGCARPGEEVIEREHRAVVLLGSQTACGVALDRCLQPHEPDIDRWDYIFSQRDNNDGIGVEVHHASPLEVDKMIAKKAWAQTTVSGACPDLQVRRWIWVASPPEGEIFLLRHNPNAKRLSDAGIEFPVVRTTLP